MCRFINADALVSTGQGILGNNVYAYCHNNSILFVDTSGYTIKLADDATDEQKEEYERAIAYLQGSETGCQLIELLDNSDVVFTIIFCDDDEMYYDPYSNAIYFDVNSGLVLGDGTSVQSAALGLAHEMGHAAQHLDGMLSGSRHEVENLNLEKYETPIAKELGEPIRSDYFDATGVMSMANSIHFITTSSERRPFWHYLFFWNWGKPKYLTIDHNLDG